MKKTIHPFGVFAGSHLSAGLALACAAGLALGSEGPGARSDLIVSEWLAPESGVWSGGGNWSTQVAPDNVDGVLYRAVIAVEPEPDFPEYTVTLNTPIEVSELLFSATQATLDATNRSLRVTGNTDIGGGRLSGGAHGAFEFGVGGVFVPRPSTGTPALVSLTGTLIEDVGLLRLGGEARLEDVSIESVGLIDVVGRAEFIGTTISGMSIEQMTQLQSGGSSDVSLMNTSLQSVDAMFRGTGAISASGIVASIDDTCVGVGDGGSLALVSTGGGGFSLAGSSMFLVESGGELMVSGDDAFVSGDESGNQSVNVNSGGEFRVTGGGRQSFVALSFVNEGLVSVDGGATLFTDGVAINNGQLVGGAYAVHGGSELDLGSDAITGLAASVTLNGVGSVFNNIETLSSIDEGGRFEVSGLRSFTSMGRLDVEDGGELDLGAGSRLDVNGVLGSVVEGVLQTGKIRVAGLLTATNTNSIERVESELEIVGGGRISDGTTADAIAGLTSIAGSGSVGVLGRVDTLHLSNLENEGTLRIGVADPDPIPSGRNLAGTTIEVAGDYIQAAGSTLVIQIGDGVFGNLTVLGDFIFGSDGEPGVAGALVVEFVGETTVGETFELITASRFLGEFESIEAVDAVNGRDLDVTFVDGTLLVTVVPAPGAALAMLGLGVFAGRRRSVAR